jgi:YVTN family beta-propeller protein
VIFVITAWILLIQIPIVNGECEGVSYSKLRSYSSISEKPGMNADKLSNNMNYSGMMRPQAQKIPTSSITLQNSNGSEVLQQDNYIFNRIQTGASPTSIAINLCLNKLYVTNSGSDDVSIINATTNKMITNLNTGITPVALAINPVTNKAYVANYGDNSISVVNGLTNKIESRYSLGITPVALAINPVTNKVYVLDYISSMISLDLNKLNE